MLALYGISSLDGSVNVEFIVSNTYVLALEASDEDLRVKDFLLMLMLQIGRAHV